MSGGPSFKHRIRLPILQHINQFLVGDPGMLNAVTEKVRFVKNLAIRKAREWTHELMESCQYLGSLRKKIETALGDLKHLTIEQRQNALELFCQFLETNNLESRVTLSS